MHRYLNITLFWNMTLRHEAIRYQRFEGEVCRQLQGSIRTLRIKTWRWKQYVPSKRCGRNATCTGRWNAQLLHCQSLETCMYPFVNI